MISKDDIDYESLEQALVDSEAEITACELQGAISGMLSAGEYSAEMYQKALAEIFADCKRKLVRQVEPIVKVLFEWTDEQINQQDSLAPMILPDDSYPTIDQLEETINWSLGFLFGFGLQIGDQMLESPEVKESLVDIANISQLELEADDDDETKEALFTLIEHIKVAVQIIHLEMVVKPKNALSSEYKDKPTLH